MFASFARDRLSRADTYNPQHPRDPGLVSLFPMFDRESASGIAVDESVALTYSAVFACVKVLAETMSSVPLFVFQRMEPRGKRKAMESPLFDLLHTKPNGEMTSAEWRECMMGALALRGNAFSQIVTNRGGEVTALWPLPANRVSWARVNGKIVYLLRLKDGTDRALMAEEVLHLRGLSSDGLSGFSPIRQARDTIGLALASERFGGRLFANGSSPRGVLQLPAGKTMTQDQHDEFLKRWNAAHEGLTNQHRTAVLPDGMVWQQVGVNPDDAQFLETRKFQIEEVARWYRMPPHKIGSMENATFTNIEHQGIEFVTDTIAPWIVKWEQGLSAALLSDADRRSGLFVEFQLQGLLRGDAAARGEFYSKLFNVGAISADEIRDKENMNPIEGGKGTVYYVPLNMVPADAARDTAAPPEPRSEAAALLEARAREEATERDARARRSAEGRRRLGRAFLPVFEDVAARIVRSEQREVMKQARKMLERRDAQSFYLWIEQFYGEHEAWIARQFLPAFTGLGEEVARAAGEDVQAADPTSGLGEFIAALVAAAAQRHAVSSREQLKAVVAESGEDGALAAVEDRLGSWVEKRPARVARRETVQLSGAVTKQTYQAAGVQRLRWVTFGPDCPFCEGLDGRIVGIESSFASKGEMFEAEGREPLRLRTNISHPPIHLGCDCGIAPA